MKCYICSYEIPEGKKCCPHCGRVITAADVKRYSQKKEQKSGPGATYRPAGTKTTEKISDYIFSDDPNAPEYKDPHAYDSATADALEYEKLISGYDSEKKKPTDSVKTTNKKKETYEIAYDDDVDYDEDDVDEEYEEEYEEPVRRQSSKKATDHVVVRDKKREKPHLKFNIKILFICIAVLIGIVIVGVGVYQIGSHLGFFGSKEPTSVSAEDPSAGKTTAEPGSATANKNQETYKTGTYTVSAETNNIFVYKSATDPRIIATIPNKTVIEIVEIYGELGKTTYNEYTGWVDLQDLAYTPDADGSEPSSEEDKPVSSGNAQGSDTPETGTYTVNLHGEGSVVNVRSEASSYSTLLTTIPEGTELTVDDIDGNWGHITYEGIDGWVFMDYLE